MLLAGALTQGWSEMRYWKQAVAAVLLAGVIPLCIATGASSATTCSTTTGYTACTETVTANLAAGSYTIKAPSSLAWGSVTLSGLNQTVKASLSVTVVNGSGATSGWRAEATMTTLKTTGGTKLATTAVSFNGSASTASATTAPTASCAATSTCTLPTLTGVTYPLTVPAGTTAPTAAPFYSAANTTGIGATSIPLDAWLHIPGSAKAGTYSATITLSVVSGP